MKKLRLYPKQEIEKQSFEGVKRHVVPNQSMGLAEIIRRFTRREPLPELREGFYSEEHGDIEKIQKEDIVDREERIRELDERIKKRDSKKKSKEPAEGGGEPLKKSTTDPSNAESEDVQ